jgi:hypothetical protein
MENPFNYFPRILYFIGTTYADGVLLHNIFKPVCANAFGFPVLLWFLLEK